MTATKRPRSNTAPERKMTAFRTDVKTLAEIDKRATAYGMTRTAYLIAAALGKLPDAVDEADARLEAIESRLEAIERRLDLAYE
jgi:hypothetical protein